MKPAMLRAALALSFGLSCWAPTAFADTAALAQRIAELEAQMQQLASQLAAAQSAPPTVPVEDLNILEVIEKTRGDGFRVGDTAIRVGGFVDLDMHYTSLSDGAIAPNSIARDFYIPGATPIGGDGTTASDLTAEATRLFFGAEHLGGNEKVSAYVEMDFLGSFQGNQRVSSSFAPRLRLGYLDYGGWRLGQDWSTFQNVSAIPESASFLILSDGMIFERQALIRYTNGPWQFALENAATTVAQPDGSSMEADTSEFPDLVARYNFKGNYGDVSVAALVRQLRMDTATGANESDELGWGVSTSGRLDLGPNDQLRFNLATGSGIGRYIGLNAVNGALLDPVDGTLSSIDSTGGLINWRHVFKGGYRFNIGYSGLFADYDRSVPAPLTESVQSVYTALLWNTAPKVTVGVEALFGRRKLTNGDDGDITRFTFSTKYSF